jgi:hypothetical protein
VREPPIQIVEIRKEHPFPPHPSRIRNTISPYNGWYYRYATFSSMPGGSLYWHVLVKQTVPVITSDLLKVREVTHLTNYGTAGYRWFEVVE